jgi:hypothetical protein
LRLGLPALAARALKGIEIRSGAVPVLEAIRFSETMLKVAAATDDGPGDLGDHLTAG